MSENCLFCKIIKGEIPSKKIYEDDDVFAFYDIAPQAPVHFLVVPKRHISTIMDMKPEDCELVGKMLYRAQIIAKELGLEESGARFVFNCKADAGQTVFTSTRTSWADKSWAGPRSQRNRRKNGPSAL